MTTNYIKFFSTKDKVTNFIVENCGYDCSACPFYSANICDHGYNYEDKEDWERSIIDKLSQENIEPCPFCGEVPEVVDYDQDESKYRVVCNNLSCPVYAKTQLCSTESEAIRLWNMRAK